VKPKKKPARFVVGRSWVFDTSSKMEVATFWYRHPHREQAARAEARRLNAWWERKRRVKR